MANQGRLPFREPDPSFLLMCPTCGYIGDEVLDFDCFGSCGDNVFCTQCGCEIEPGGKRHELGPCCEEALTLPDDKRAADYLAMVRKMHEGEE